MATGSRVDRTIGLFAIRAYQKWISPYKGYRCAHRLYHGGESCSEYASRILNEQGWRKLRSKMKDRFAACRNAARFLKSEAMTDASEGEAAASEEHTGSKSKSKQSWCDSWMVCDGCHFPGCGGLDIPDAGCDAGGCDGCG